MNEKYEKAVIDRCNTILKKSKSRIDASIIDFYRLKQPKTSLLRKLAHKFGPHVVGFVIGFTISFSVLFLILM